MRQVVIKDFRGQVVAFVGTQDEFREQHDAARYLGSSDHAVMAWIDWVESTGPGNGTRLMEELLMVLEAENVSLIGLEVVPKNPAEIEKTVSFYEKFGFVSLGLLAPFEEAKLMLREASWNGIE